MLLVCLRLFEDVLVLFASSEWDIQPALDGSQLSVKLQGLRRTVV